MAWWIVQQPNNKFGRFSDVVDDFTIMNMSEVEAIELCKKYLGEKDANRKVQRAFKNFERWDDAIETIKEVYGNNAANKRKKEGE